MAEEKSLIRRMAYDKSSSYWVCGSYIIAWYVDKEGITKKPQTLRVSIEKRF